jgi:hypothetical protein
MRKLTYRDLAWDGVVDVVRAAAETADASDDVEAALARLRIRFDAAVDADGTLARALDRTRDEPDAETNTVDPINRADEIAAHIGDTFKTR